MQTQLWGLRSGYLTQLLKQTGGKQIQVAWWNQARMQKKLASLLPKLQDI